MRNENAASEGTIPLDDDPNRRLNHDQEYTVAAMLRCLREISPSATLTMTPNRTFAGEDVLEASLGWYQPYGLLAVRDTGRARWLEP